MIRAIGGRSNASHKMEDDQLGFIRYGIGVGGQRTISSSNARKSTFVQG